MIHRQIVPIASLLATLVSTSWAAEAEHGHGGEVPVLTLLFSLVNLLLFAFILGRYAAPAIRLWVRARRNGIVTDLEEAAAALGEATRLKEEWDAKFARLHETIRQMQEQARLEAERERQRIVGGAREVAASILRDAERTIAAEVHRMRSELRAELAREAVRIAEGEVRRRWTVEDQRRSVSEFLEQVGR